MAEPSLANLTDVVLAKSKLMSFTKFCEELGIQNDNMEWLQSAMSDSEPYLTSVQEQQAYTVEFRSLWLNLKTKLYETEDMLDNLDKLRHVLITKATQTPKVGKRVDVEQMMMRPHKVSDNGAKRGIRFFLIFNKVMVLLLVVFVAFMYA